MELVVFNLKWAVILLSFSNQLNLPLSPTFSYFLPLLKSLNLPNYTLTKILPPDFNQNSLNFPATKSTVTSTSFIFPWLLLPSHS